MNDPVTRAERSSIDQEGIMSTKADYSAEEWKAIASAPVAAGLVITLSDVSDPVGIAKEAMAVGRAISASTLSDKPEIVRSLVESVKTGNGRPELPELPTGDRAQTKDAVIGAIRNAVEAVQRRSPGEVEAYKVWLASVAAKVSQASKNGGLFGVGGTLVSAQEQEALSRLTDVLGVKTQRTTSSRNDEINHAIHARPGAGSPTWQRRRPPEWIRR